MTARQRVGTLMLGLGYALVFYWCYLGYLHPYFDYTGYRVIERDLSFLMLSLVLAVIPVAFFRGVQAVSSVIALIVYFVLYVPIIGTFALASNRSLAEIGLVEIVFGLCMSFLFLADAIIIANPVALRVRGNAMPWMLLVTVLAAAYLIAAYGDRLAFVSFGQAIYAQRAAAAEVGGSLLTRYTSSFLTNLLAPLCLSYGLATRRWRYFAAGTVGCVVLYAAQAAKITILLPVVYGGFYYAFRGDRIRRFAPRFGIGLAVAMVALMLVAGLGTVPFLASSLLISRTIGNGGMLTMSYYDFFAHHPQTAYSHINVVGSLTGLYPYGDDLLGQVVGQYYWSTEMNANANFWATDGIAALGLAGVPIATALLFGLLVAMNSITRKLDLAFVVLCFLPFVQYILNASLFSSLWSGGGFILLGLFLANTWPASLAGRDETAPQTALSA